MRMPFAAWHWSEMPLRVASSTKASTREGNVDSEKLTGSSPPVWNSPRARSSALAWESSTR